MLQRGGCKCALGIKGVLWDNNLCMWVKTEKGHNIEEKIGSNLMRQSAWSCLVTALCHLYPFHFLQPHDYMTTINVSCRPAPNQLLAYDSHYLHLSQRVNGAQLGLCRQEALVLVSGFK